MKLIQLLRNSFFLLAANLLAGALNYLYQVKGAAALRAVDYGALSLWLAYVGLALAVGAAAQILSNFMPIARSRIHLVGGGAVILGAATAGLLLLTSSTSSQWDAPSLSLGVITVVIGIFFNFLQGQLQSQGLFAAMSIGLFAQAATRIALISGTTQANRYALATTVSLAIGVALGGAALLIAHFKQGWQVAQSHLQNRKILSEIAGALILAVSIALIPQMDLLNLRWARSPEELGQFARAALFAKAVFFAALTLLQVTLPFHIRQLRGGITAQEFASVQKLERLGLAACYLGSIALYWLGPWLTRRLLGFELAREQRFWVPLSCLAMTALYGHLQKIQLRCAEGRWNLAAFRLAALVLGMGIAALIQPSTVTVYLCGALAYYFTTGLFRGRKMVNE